MYAIIVNVCFESVEIIIHLVLNIFYLKSRYLLHVNRCTVGNSYRTPIYRSTTYRFLIIYRNSKNCLMLVIKIKINFSGC